MWYPSVLPADQMSCAMLDYILHWHHTSNIPPVILTALFRCSLISADVQSSMPAGEIRDFSVKEHLLVMTLCKLFIGSLYAHQDVACFGCDPHDWLLWCITCLNNRIQIFVDNMASKWFQTWTCCHHCLYAEVYKNSLQSWIKLKIALHCSSPLEMCCMASTTHTCTTRLSALDFTFIPEESLTLQWFMPCQCTRPGH